MPKRLKANRSLSFSTAKPICWDSCFLKAFRATFQASVPLKKLSGVDASIHSSFSG